MPGEVFRQLVAGHESFERHFRFGLAHNLQAQAPGGLDSAGLDAFLVQSRVDEVMTRDVLTCLPATTVKAAAHLMAVRQAGSVVKVLAFGRSPDCPVLEIMSQPVHTLGPGSHAFEALLAMSAHGVHHLVVTENERVVGIISDHDLRGLTGSSPVSVVRDIEKVATLDELVQVRHKIDRVLEMLLKLGGSTPTMLALATEFNDRLTIPELLTLRFATIFFDFRGIYAEADFIDNLQAKLKEYLEGNRLFLRYMAKNALYNRPPLGFLRQFVVEKSGEHKNKLNLKLSRLTPIVDAALVMALNLGSNQTNTLERLELIIQAGLVKPALHADLRGAMLNHAFLAGAMLSGADLRQVKSSWLAFNAPVGTWQDSHGAHLDSVDLREADFLGASLVAASLRSANLEHTNLTGMRMSTCCGSQRFKPYAEGQIFLEEYRQAHHAWFWLWWITSDCGHSLMCWAGWSLGFALIFGVLFCQLGQERFVVEPVPFTFLTMLYYSVVTFTTLGFGDITPKTEAAAGLVMAEVTLGCIMLGGLISILANKLARRG